MTQNNMADIIIIGAGMAGLGLAALLGRQGFAVTVIDREDPAHMATEAFDARTVALSAGSRQVLEPLGIWDDIVGQAAAITEIDVQEGHDPFLLNFKAGQIKADAFGWIFPNHIVRGTLYETARQAGVQFVQGSLKDIATQAEQVTATLQTGEVIPARLLVGADGRFSRVRDLLGINGVSLAYRQTALVGLVEHDLPHQGLAVERFYPGGPFAILPFTDDTNGAHRSAVVWTRDDVKGQKSVLPKLEQVSAELEPLFDARYGVVKAVGKWAQYPLSLFHAKTFIAPRVALISDAAHAIHPIAGQGLNLGMRDVDVLAALLAEAKTAGSDIGSKILLETYQTQRRFDVFAMVAATDMLNRLFGNKMRSMRWLRSAGLGAVNRIGPLKRFFMRTAMGQ